MRSAKKWWIAGILVIALVLLVVGVRQYRLGAVDRILEGPRGPSGELSKEQMTELLGYMAEDSHSMRSRMWLGSSWLGEILGHRTRAGMYPVQYTWEKVIREGRVVVGPVVEIAVDPSQERETLGKAWLTLTEFNDDPRVLEALFRMPAEAGIPLDRILPLFFPADWDNPPYKPNEAAAWLEEDLKTKSYDEICLGLLDTLLAKKALYPGDMDVLLWLNRYYGDDFDEWLSGVSPEALAFRDRELAKGYDPLSAFRLFTSGTDGGLVDDKGINAVWKRPEDRKACRELLEAAAWPMEGTVHPPEEGWRKRLQDWYDENRDSLKYDREKRRFVVTE